MIAPTIKSTQQQKINIINPLPTNTIFKQTIKKNFNIIITYYHNQKLIPIKLTTFKKTINITLKLPIIKTSINHSTTFNITNHNITNKTNIIKTIKLTTQLTSHTLKTKTNTFINHTTNLTNNTILN